MTLKKAIKLLTEFNNGKYSCDAPTFREAVKLSNEAMKLILELRAFYNIESANLLPGETEE